MNLEQAKQVLASRNYFEMKSSDFWSEIDLYAGEAEMEQLEEAENIYLLSLPDDTAGGEYSEDGQSLAWGEYT